MWRHLGLRRHRRAAVSETGDLPLQMTALISQSFDLPRLLVNQFAELLMAMFQITEAGFNCSYMRFIHA